MTFQFRTFLKLVTTIVLMNVVHNTHSLAATSFYDTIDEVDDVGIFVTSADYHLGQLWLGSGNGLVQISPGDERIFNTASRHLPSDQINDVLIDNQGQVWASIKGGIFKYSIYEGRSRLFAESEGIPQEDCRDLEQSFDLSSLWVVCGKNLLSLNLSDDSVHLFDLENYLKHPQDKFIKVKVHSDNFLVLASHITTFLFDMQSGKIVREFEDLRLFNTEIQPINNEEFLMATTDGVYLFDINQSEAISHFRVSSKFSIANDVVYSMAEFSDNEALLLMEGGGLYKLNTKTFDLSEIQMFSPYLSSKHIPRVLSYVQVDESFAISTNENGIHIYPPSASFISFFEKNGNKLHDAFFSRDIDNKILAGDDNGAYLIDSVGREIKLLVSNLGTLLDGFGYKDGYLLSSDEKGLLYVNSDGVILEESIHFKGLPEGTVTDINRFFELKNGELLLGLYGDDAIEGGIYKGSFKNGFEALSLGHNVSDLVEGYDENIYGLAAQTGVYKVDKDFQVTHYPMPDELDYLDCIEPYNEKVIFLCTRTHGVIQFDITNGEYKQAFTQSTMLSTVIRDIIVDKNQRIWLMTANGLVTFKDLHDKGFFFKSSDGILSKEFSLNSAINLSLSQILMFGNKDVFTIDVDHIDEYIGNKLAKVTEAQVIEHSYSYLHSEDDEPVSSKLDFRATERLEFQYDVLNLRFRFTHNNFLDRKLIRYESRLIGLDDEWRILDKDDRQITFSTLPPGKYEFQLRANDPRSFAEQPIKSIFITVHPPWWQTTIAYICYIVFFILVVYFTQWFRGRQLQRKNLELAEKVKERTATIENLLNQKQTFFANVSHEFRTPLSLIMGPIDVLSEKLSKHEEKHQLSIMKRNTNRLMRLVDQILELAKFETSKHLPKEVYDVNNVLSVLASSFSSLLEAKQQTLKVKVAKDTKLRLIEDSLEMIIGNLLSNAIKYCPEGAKVLIETSEENGRIKIVVSDNGKGISPDNLKLLFERFTRFDAGEDVQGSGIGLALVKQLVVSNDGTIDVESEVDKGTTFTICFPVNVAQNETVTHVVKQHVVDSGYEEETEEETKEEIKDPIKSDFVEATKDDTDDGSSSNKSKILVVEDNPDLRSYLTETLSPDYEIQLAKNGQEGLKKAQQNIPDLILSDVLMPIMNGYELSNAIRSDDATSHIPIILLTAKGDDLSRMKGWEENVDDYLTKPFKLNELRGRISRLISIRDILKKKHTSELTNNLAIKNNEAISFQTKRDKEFFVRFEKVISEHYNEENFSRAEAASYLALSERQLNRKLSALVDYNFSEYLRKYRLQRGRDLLLSGRQVTEVAYEVGFNSPSYFSSCFKAEFEQTPKQYVEERENQTPVG